MKMKGPGEEWNAMDPDWASWQWDDHDKDNPEPPLWMAPEPRYTVREMGLILEGLASGRRPSHRPMSDREFERRYDPVAAEHKEMAGLLKELISTFQAAVEARQERPAPRQFEPAPYVPRSTAPKPTRGSVDL